MALPRSRVTLRVRLGRITVQSTAGNLLSDCFSTDNELLMEMLSTDVGSLDHGFRIP